MANIEMTTNIENLRNAGVYTFFGWVTIVNHDTDKRVKHLVDVCGDYEVCKSSVYDAANRFSRNFKLVGIEVEVRHLSK